MIPSEHAIWIIYSGRRRRFFDQFERENLVFLQTPGFAATPDTFSDIQKIRQHLRMADAIYAYNSKISVVNVPSRNPRSYSALSDNKNRSFNQAAGNVDRLFNKVKLGDLVLSPAIGHYKGMLIGEVIKEWEASDKVAVDKLHDEEVPCRKVRWIHKEISRHDFPAQISQRIWNSHAVSELDTVFYEDIYNIVFDNYVTENKSKIDFHAPLYSSKDPLDTYEGGALIKYFTAAFLAHQNGRLDAFAAQDLTLIIHNYS